MKLKKYKFGAKTYIAIVDGADCPVDPYVTAYICSMSGGVAFNTAVRYAAELIFVLTHFSYKQIDLVSRVGSGQLISDYEYMQWYDKCCFSVGAVHDLGVLSFKKMGGKGFRNIISANQRVMSRVNGNTTRGRLRRLREFLEWLFAKFHYKREVAMEITEALSRLTQKMRLDEEGIRPNESRGLKSLDESVIPDGVFERLLEIIKPSSPDNPFKKAKHRNYLIVSVLAQSGIRRGALAKAKISDFQFYGSFDSFQVYRSVDESMDPRLDKPNQKTRAHIATIEPELMKEIKYYIDVTRAAIHEAILHDYVFVSETNSRETVGQPLSLKSINSIFHVLSQALNFHIHPHMLRHKWNEIYDAKGVAMGVDQRRLEDARKYAMGWSQNSTMNEIYNQKRLAKLAREISRCHQERIDRL